MLLISNQAYIHWSILLTVYGIVAEIFQQLCINFARKHFFYYTFSYLLLCCKIHTTALIIVISSWCTQSLGKLKGGIIILDSGGLRKARCSYFLKPYKSNPN